MKASTLRRNTSQIRFAPYDIPIRSQSMLTPTKRREENIETILHRILEPVSLDTIEEQHTAWCDIRDESSRTPRSYHSPIIPFNERVRDLFHIFQTNIGTVIKLMEDYIQNTHNTDVNPQLYEQIRERLIIVKGFNDELNTYINSYSDDTDENDVVENIHIWFHKILALLRENQPYIDYIQSVSSRRKIQFIHIPPNTTDTKHILILCIILHGTHGIGYPSLLAVPEGKNICKTTLALPGDPTFNSPTQLNEIMSDYYIPVYNNSDVKNKLEDSFISSFTNISQYLKYPILQKITSHLHPVDNKTNDYIQLKYKTWCDSIRNSTSSLMFQTRYNEYIKNKTYGIKKDDANILHNNIYVLLDTSGRFTPGQQLVDYGSTFRERGKKAASNTLQEIINIFYSSGWYDIGIIDKTCESGNLSISHVESFPSIITNHRLPHFRGGSRKTKKSKKSKKSKNSKTTRRLSFINKMRRKTKHTRK